MRTVKISDVVTVETGENFVAAALAAARADSAVTLDLRRVKSLDSAVAPRLGNALRYLSSMASLTVQLPPDEASLQRIASSGIGDQLARHSGKLLKGNAAATRELRALLTRAAPSTIATILLRDVFSHETFVPRDAVLVKDALDAWLSSLPPAEGRLPVDDDLMTIAEVVAEATKNIQDHAQRNPLPRDTEVVSYASFAWRRAGNFALVPEGFVSQDSSSIYLARMRERSDRGGVGGYLEILVVDDGVGMAGRQRLDLSVYGDRGAFAERDAFVEALSAGGSVKLRAQDCPVEATPPGMGSALIAETVVRLHGYVSIRTGRFLAFLDGSPGHATTPEFAVDGEVRPFIPGCIWSVLIPVYAEAAPTAEDR